MEGSFHLVSYPLVPCSLEPPYEGPFGAVLGYLMGPVSPDGGGSYTVSVLPSNFLTSLSSIFPPLCFSLPLIFFCLFIFLFIFGDSLISVFFPFFFFFFFFCSFFCHFLCLIPSLLLTVDQSGSVNTGQPLVNSVRTDSALIGGTVTNMFCIIVSSTTISANCLAFSSCCFYLRPPLN